MVTIAARSAARSAFAVTAAVPLLLFGAGTAPAYACDPHTGENCDLVPEEGFVISDEPTHPGTVNIIADDPAALPPEQVPPDVTWENCELLIHMTNYMCGSGPAQSNPPH